MPYAITPPDGADWTIDVEPSADGGLGGAPARLTLGMDRPDARRLARKTLACSGDAMERTFIGGSSSEPG